MYKTQFFLLLMGLGFIAFGVHSLFDPSTWTKNMGVETINADGIFELRSIYGGTSIGAGILLLLASFKEKYTRPALFFIVAYMGGYALARLAAVGLDGLPSNKLLVFWGIEIVCALIAILLLRGLKTES